jgi:hypothetical protein
MKLSIIRNKSTNLINKERTEYLYDTEEDAMKDACIFESSLVKNEPEMMQFCVLGVNLPSRKLN